jgi:hypothetical protein
MVAIAMFAKFAKFAVVTSAKTYESARGNQAWKSALSSA